MLRLNSIFIDTNAKQQRIFQTPHSSNIALINDQQLSQLERESLRKDAFEPARISAPNNRNTFSNPAIGNVGQLNLSPSSDFASLENIKPSFSLFRGANILSLDIDGGSSSGEFSSLSNVSPIKFAISSLKYIWIVAITGAIFYFVKKVRNDNENE